MSYKILKIYDHVMTDPRLLTLREKYLVCYVWSWQDQGKCCFPNDQFLASLLDLNTGDLHKLLTELQNRRIIKINYGNGGTARMISVLVPGKEEDVCENLDIFSEL